MANYSDPYAVHETLTASSVDYVTLSNASSSAFTVLNRTGTAEIYVTYESGTTNPTAPTVGGNSTSVVPAAICALTIPVSAGSVVVALISASAQSYSVEALG